MSMFQHIIVNVHDHLESYRLTVWADGVARLDGRRGPWAGLWTGLVSEIRLHQVLALLENVENPTEGHLPGTHQVSLSFHDKTRDLKFDRGTAEPMPWIVIQLFSGLVTETTWFPDQVQWLSNASSFRGADRVLLAHRGAHARGIIQDGTVIVLAGSLATANSMSSLSKTHAKLRYQLIETGAWDSVSPEHFQLNKHIFFRTLGVAASTLCGAPSSGVQAWTTEGGMPLRLQALRESVEE